MTFFLLDLILCMALELELNVACIMSVRGREQAATSNGEGNSEGENKTHKGNFSFTVSVLTTKLKNNRDGEDHNLKENKGSGF